MSGIKGKSGGKREGAGRKKKPVVPDKPIPTKFNDIESVYDDMQKCNMELLDFPKDLNDIPYAKEAWDYVLLCEKNSKIHLLNARHYEALKSYCLAVSMRRLLISSWKKDGCPTSVVDDRGNIKVHPILKEIENKNKSVNEYAEALGLTVLGEYKLAKITQNSPKLTGGKNPVVETDSMFD